MLKSAFCSKEFVAHFGGQDLLHDEGRWASHVFYAALAGV